MGIMESSTLKEVNEISGEGCNRTTCMQLVPWFEILQWTSSPHLVLVLAPQMLFDLINQSCAEFLELMISFLEIIGV